MNRQRKFRIWNGEKMFYPQEAVGWGKRYYLKLGGEVMFHNANISSHTEIDHAIALDWTSLTDKRGRDIYEGDIIHYWVDGQGEEMFVDVVEFRDGMFTLKGENEPLHQILSESEDYEVAGNIYENRILGE